MWVAIRQIVNYYVKLGGLEHLMDLGGFSFFTLRVQFYSQSWELKKEFKILVSNLDFNLYDSYWLKDTSYFRPTLEKIKEDNLAKEMKTKKEVKNTPKKEENKKKIVKEEKPQNKSSLETNLIQEKKTVINKSSPKEKVKKKRIVSPLKAYLNNLKTEKKE